MADLGRGFPTNSQDVLCRAIGKDVELNFLRGAGSPAGKTRSIYLKLRFLTPEELASAP